jgi:hypothetical protein
LKSTGRTFEKVGKALCGLTDGNGKDRSQPCPFCGGNNRFWYSTESNRWFCRKCKPTGGWDAIALSMQKRNVDFKEAVRLIAETTGYIDTDEMHVRHTVDEVKKAVQEGKPILSLDTWRLDADSPIYKATAVHRPDILFDDYQRAGAKLFKDGIAIPMFDNDGVTSGWVRYFRRGGKPKLIGKSGIVGVDAIYNLRTAKSARIVFKTAGVSDYLVLSGVIAALDLEAYYYAFTNGAGENEKPDKFEPLLRPALTWQAVGIIADNDDVGTQGALRWAEHFSEYAADVRIVRVATGWKPSHAAQECGVSPAYVNQCQKRYRASWYEYISDKKEAAREAA